MTREELKDTIYSILFRQIDDGSADELIEATQEIAELWAPPTAEGAEEFLLSKGYAETVKHPADGIITPTFTWSHVIELLQEFTTLHAQQIADKMVEKASPSNEQIHEAALAWARDHSEAPDKDCPTWIIHDYEAGAYFVRQCYGCWNKTDENYDKQLLIFIKWLRYRNFTDDTMRDEDWLELYCSDPEINE